MSQPSKNAADAASKALQLMLSRKVVRLGPVLKTVKSDRKPKDRRLR